MSIDIAYGFLDFFSHSDWLSSLPFELFRKYLQTLLKLCEDIHSKEKKLLFPKRVNNFIYTISVTFLYHVTEQTVLETLKRLYQLLSNNNLIWFCFFF